MKQDEKMIIEEKKYKAGYVVKTVLSRSDFEAVVLSEGENPIDAEDLADYINQNKDKVIITKQAYTPDGIYIGTPKTAHYLIVKKGIKPELSDTEHKVCSIGFCEKEQKWYGWSHRSIYGFGIGDKVKKGDCTNSSGWTAKYLREHPEKDRRLPVGFTAKDLNDCKRMAIAFADSVG